MSNYNQPSRSKSRRAGHPCGLPQGPGIVVSVLTVLACVLLMLSTGCGVDVNVEGLRDVKVIHEVNVDSIKPYITSYCGLGNNTPEDIEACVNLEIGKLLGKL
jgi:hypothetical protein